MSKNDTFSDLRFLFMSFVLNEGLRRDGEKKAEEKRDKARTAAQTRLNNEREWVASQMATVNMSHEETLGLLKGASLRDLLPPDPPPVTNTSTTSPKAGLSEAADRVASSAHGLKQAIDNLTQLWKRQAARRKQLTVLAVIVAGMLIIWGIQPCEWLDTLLARRSGCAATLYSYDSNESYLREVSFSPNGRYLASLHYNEGSLKIWDFEGEKLVDIMEPNERTFTRITSVAFAPESDLVAIGFDGGDIDIRRLSGGKVITIREGEYPRVAFSSDGTLVTWSLGGEVLSFWNVAAGSRENSITGFGVPIRDVAFSQTENLMAVLLSYEQKVHEVEVWSLDSNEVVKQIRIAGDDFYGLGNVAVDPSGRIVAVGMDRRATLWIISTGRMVNQCAMPTNVSRGKGTSGYVRFSPDGERIAIAYGSGITLCETDTGTIVRSYDDPAWKNSFSFAPDGSAIASGGQNLWRFNVLRLWKVE